MANPWSTEVSSLCPNTNHEVNGKLLKLMEWFTKLDISRTKHDFPKTQSVAPPPHPFFLKVGVEKFGQRPKGGGLSGDF